MTVTADKSPSTGSGDVVPKEDLVTVTIDDVEVSVPKGTLVIRAAELIGVEVPRFCDHPLLEPVGACRQCLVEIPDAGNGRGMPKPQASCTLEVMPGMQVRTQVSSPVAEKAQHGNMEFLLINHPLDCPICDKGGECPLQNQAMSHGYAESRFTDLKRTFPKPINISAQVLLDRERCVLCARCTRFSEQIAGDPFIALVERGALQQVGIYEREPFESYFSGNTIQICPVGALTSAAYRFRSRPFDLVSTPSVAEHDACGSAIRVDHRRGTVMRRMAGNDPEVNEEWITDKDRFAFRYGRGDDRLTYPLVRDTDAATGESVLRPASWPEALQAAADGLKQAGDSVGVLTGGRLTVQDAYGYSKFARVVLGTNNIDFRSRPNTAEEAEFLAHAVAGSASRPGAAPVSFDDLESASGVLLVSFEAEEEAGTIFLRLRKAHRKSKLKSWTLAPYLSNGARKHGATLIKTVPGAEAATLNQLPAGVQLDADSVILVGERAALSSGTLTAVLALSRSTGARIAWIPRRAGDRGAVEAGCLPNLLPGGRPISDASARVDLASAWGVTEVPALEGRDGDEMLMSAADAELGALVVAGVDPGDLMDPQSALEGLEQVGFVISVEQRASSVTERADVVLPVSLIEERAGSFLTWEGRERPFPVVIKRDNVMTDLRVLAALADLLGKDLGVRSAAEASAELAELGPWDGHVAPAPNIEPGRASVPGTTTVVLATWRLAIDASRSVDNEPELLATARRTVARLSTATAEAAGIGDQIRIENDHGSLQLPVELVPEMADGVVWVPTLAPGIGVADRLAAAAGDVVRIAAPEASADPVEDEQGA
ncbi:NADH-quinone oxidoreductase subunit G [Microlunatus speluncae]|uniref:NADH-quinone oxidoreductase subunit G n=1 Tax=Microlunatus speluncae TaxID=2594267 RepID=UPI00126627C5|nr:NADH-quinone oxidoreductase subunit G [Microlunatus speluncae]